MPDVGERLDNIEQRLTGVAQHFVKVDEHFGEIKERLDTIDKRLDNVDERFDKIDERFDKVDDRFVKVDDRLDTLTSDVQKLRVLGEENTTQIKLIAEVQAHQGHVLQQIVQDIEPLKILPALFTKVVQDHERRITALERTGQ
jgi:archaellum component FlaC